MKSISEQIEYHKNKISELQKQKSFPHPSKTELSSLRKEVSKLLQGQYKTIYCEEYNVNMTIRFSWEDDIYASYFVYDINFPDKKNNNLIKKYYSFDDIEDTDWILKTKEYKIFQNRIDTVIKKSDDLKEKCQNNFDFERDILDEIS